MRLKSARIRNFKRFVDLSIQGLPPDVKLVVLLGPNGCGKSSLFDAFQSELRIPYLFGMNPELERYYRRASVDVPVQNHQVTWSSTVANGGAKVDHGSGGMVLPRRSKTLPVCQPFPVMGRVGGFTPWSCIARSVWRAGTG